MSTAGRKISSTSHTNDFMLRLSCSGPAASGETIVEPEISDSTAIAEAVNTSPAKRRSRYCPHGRTTVSACTNGMLQRFSSQRLSRLTNVSQTNATCSLRHDAITFASGSYKSENCRAHRLANWANQFTPATQYALRCSTASSCAGGMRISEHRRHRTHLPRAVLQSATNTQGPAPADTHRANYPTNHRMYPP